MQDGKCELENGKMFEREFWTSQALKWMTENLH